MISYVLIGFLLVYAKIVHSSGGCFVNKGNTSLYQREIEAMPKGLHMFADNGSLIEITREELPEIKITFTRRYLKRPNTFHLFTRRNPTLSQQLWTNDQEILAQSYLDPRKETRFVTHGWISTGNNRACTIIRDAYLKNDDGNVIVLDWSGTSFRPYVTATRQVLSIAWEVARMIDFLVEYGQLHPDNITLIGHSLGAHIMGLAGYYSKYKLRHVVGLDPALPMFKFAGPGTSISKMDAKHVQIIHTNGGFLGYLRPVGHADFYPNGGIKQPGCFPADLLACACSHESAFLYFAASIGRSEPFYGRKCESYRRYKAGYCLSREVVPMGGTNLDYAKPGKYYLRINQRRTRFTP